MKILLLLILSVTSGCGLLPGPAFGQVYNDSAGGLLHPAALKGLFDTDEPLAIRLTGNINELMKDRSDKPKSHPLLLSCKTGDGNEFSIAIKAKTRGHFRRTMGGCLYPPILLQFPNNDTLSSSIFFQQHKLKVVMPCRGDEYVIHEWLAYKIYNLVTPQSFRARLAAIELDDTKKNKVTQPFYAILLEEEQQMAVRNHDILIKKEMRPEQTEPLAFLKMAVFQYLIGNTDWSVQYQNIKLVAADSNSLPVAVPYDFDHAGIVNAPYAKPAEELEMNSVRERRYRGYCITEMKRFNEVVNVYNQLQPAIYKLYTGCPLLEAKYVRSSIQYLDEFYKTINDPAALQKEFTYPCNKSGSGKVVIKGLKED